MKLKYFSVLATLLGTLVLENINVEGLNSLNLSNLTDGNENFPSTTSLVSISVPSNTSAVAAAEQKDTNDIGQIASATQETADAVRAKQVHPLDKDPMMVISKHFKTINDYINIEKCCKEYNGIIEKYKDNPIPLKNEKERELFKNIETYHYYARCYAEDKVNEDEKFIEKDTRIKQFIHWDVSYLWWKKNKKENHVYKNVEYYRGDMKKHLRDHKGKDLDYRNSKEVFLKEENVVLEDGITSIGPSCFADCANLTTIKIPDSVTSIRPWCFEGCSSLKETTIPASVIEIGMDCFYRTTTQVKIILDPEEKNLDVIFWLILKLGLDRVHIVNNEYKQVDFHKDEIAKGYIISKDKVFYWLRNSDINKDKTSVEIPEEVGTLIEYCFENCKSLITITIPDRVMSIGNFCFAGCQSLKNITIPSKVTSISYGCFMNCENLTTIKIPSSVIFIGSYCFNGCQSLKNITIPNNVTSIGNECFNGCKALESIIIPSRITSLGYGCFDGCQSLKNITIPDSVMSILQYCFMNCENLTTITIPDSVMSIGNQCFSGCKALESIIIPSSVTCMEESCFDNCNKLTEIKVVIGEKNRNENINVFKERKDEYEDIVKPVNKDGEVIKGDF